jgi:hypothetical protein
MPKASFSVVSQQFMRLPEAFYFYYAAKHADLILMLRAKSSAFITRGK